MHRCRKRWLWTKIRCTGVANGDFGMFLPLPDLLPLDRSRKHRFSIHLGSLGCLLSFPWHLLGRLKHPFSAISLVTLEGHQSDKWLGRFVGPWGSWRGLLSSPWHFCEPLGTLSVSFHLSFWRASKVTYISAYPLLLGVRKQEDFVIKKNTLKSSNQKVFQSNKTRWSLASSDLKPSLYSDGSTLVYLYMPGICTHFLYVIDSVCIGD